MMPTDAGGLARRCRVQLTRKGVYGVVPGPPETSAILWNGGEKLFGKKIVMPTDAGGLA